MQTLATSIGNPADCPPQDSRDSPSDQEMENLDFTIVYPTSDEAAISKHHSRRGSQSRSRSASKYRSEGDGKSHIVSPVDQQNHPQRQKQSHNSTCQSESTMSHNLAPEYSFICTFTQMSKYLFDLQRDQNNLVQDHMPKSLHMMSMPLQQIFHRVSMFIELSKTATNHLELMNSQRTTSEIQSLTHLSLMVISVTMDIYLSLAHGGIFWGNGASTEMVHADKTSNSNTMHVVEESPQQACMSCLIRACNSTPLTVVLNLTVMDFHMAQFQGQISQTFSYRLTFDQAASEELQRIQSQTCHLRARLQSCIASVVSGDRT